MASRNSFFSAALFVKCITRFWPLWAAYLIVWVLVLPVALAGELQYSPDSWDLYRFVYDQAGGSAAILSMAFGVMAAMAVFSHLYTPRAAGGFAALPIRREGVYISHFAAGFACLAAANVVVFLITVAVEAAYGCLTIGPLLVWLAAVTMSNLFFYGFACFCAQLTGNVLVLPVVYVVLNFTAYVVETLVRSVLEMIVFGMPNTGMSFMVLSPVACLLSNCGGATEWYEVTVNGVIKEAERYFFHGWGLLGIYSAAGVLFAFGGMLLYRARRMESAGDVVAVNCLKPVFKYCMAFGSALVIGSLIYAATGAGAEGVYAWAGLTVCAVIGGAIGYFAAEMLIRKSLRVFRGNWKGCIVASAVVIALLSAAEFDLFGYEKARPDLANVECVTVIANGESFVARENIETALELQKSIVNNKSHHESRGTGLTAVFIWELKDGSEMMRRYTISATPTEYETPGTDANILGRLLNSDEAITQRKALSVTASRDAITYAGVDYYSEESGYVYTELELTPEEAWELYSQCIIPDIEDGALGRVWLVDCQDYFDTAYSASIHIEFQEPYRDANGEISYMTDRFRTVPTVDSHRTNAWLAEHGVDLVLGRDVPENQDWYKELQEKAHAIGVIGGSDGPTVTVVGKTTMNP